MVILYDSVLSSLIVSPNPLGSLPPRNRDPEIVQVVRNIPSHFISIGEKKNLTPKNQNLKPNHHPYHPKTGITKFVIQIPQEQHLVQSDPVFTTDE